MITVKIVGRLFDDYIVEYKGARYLLSDADIFITDNIAYTYPDKLTRRH